MRLRTLALHALPPQVARLFGLAFTVAACSNAASAGPTDASGSEADCMLLEACCEALGASVPDAMLGACVASVMEGGGACSSALVSLQLGGRCAGTAAPASSQVARMESPASSTGSARAPSTSSGETTPGSSAASTSVPASATSATTTTTATTATTLATTATATTALSSASSGRSSSFSAETSSAAPTSSSATSTGTRATMPPPLSCVAPPGTVPPGFAPPTGVVGSACSPAEATTLGDCVLGADAGENACTDAVTADGGAPNACFDCLYTHVPAASNGPSLWGSYLQVELEPAADDAADAFLFNLGYNLGGCILGASAPSSSGAACGLDMMQLDACQFAVCVPLCPVPDPGAGEPVSASALAALDACFDATETGACSAYYSAAVRDCAPLEDAGAGSAFGRCVALIAEDNGDPDAGAGTPASEAALIGLTCGGVDAGF